VKLKSIAKLLGIIVGLLVLAYVGILVYGIWDFRSIQISVPVEPNVMMTEEAAIKISHEALVKAGKNVDELEPRKFNGTNYFARNIYQTNNGYVIWGQKEGIDGIDFHGDNTFSVHMERQGDSVACDVGKTK